MYKNFITSLIALEHNKVTIFVYFYFVAVQTKVEKIYLHSLCRVLEDWHPVQVSEVFILLDGVSTSMMLFCFWLKTFINIKMLYFPLSPFKKFQSLTTVPYHKAITIKDRKGHNYFNLHNINESNLLMPNTQVIFK